MLFFNTSFFSVQFFFFPRFFPISVCVCFILFISHEFAHVLVCLIRCKPFYTFKPIKRSKNSFIWPNHLSGVLCVARLLVRSFLHLPFTHLPAHTVHILHMDECGHTSALYALPESWIGQRTCCFQCCCSSYTSASIKISVKISRWRIYLTY